MLRVSEACQEHIRPTMAAKRVVFLSYLFVLLIVNLRACSAYRPAPKGLSETTPTGGRRWSANKGDLGMTEETGNDMDHSGDNGAGFGAQGVDGSAPGASINGVGIGFGGGGGVGIGDSGGIGIGAGAGVGIGLGGGGGPDEPPEPPVPEPPVPKPPVPPVPKPPVDPDLPKPPVDPDMPKPPGIPGTGMGGSGGGGGGIGKHRLLPPNTPTGGLTECQPLNCANGDCGTSTMYFGSTSISDEDKINAMIIHQTATAMSLDPDHVHGQMVMRNTEGNSYSKNGEQKTADPEPDPDHSQKMSNMGSGLN